MRIKIIWSLNTQALTTRVHAPFLTTPESSFPLCYKMFFPLLQNISVAKRRHHRAQTGGGRRWRRGSDSAVERSVIWVQILGTREDRTRSCAVSSNLRPILLDNGVWEHLTPWLCLCGLLKFPVIEEEACLPLPTCDPMSVRREHLLFCLTVDLLWKKIGQVRLAEIWLLLIYCERKTLLFR